MDSRVAWIGRVLFSSVACATLALAGTAQGERSDGLQLRTQESTSRVTLEGFVLAPDGLPAENAVVTSSAGGQAITDAAGAYRLEVDVPLEATSVEVTAVDSAGGNLVASTSVPLSAARPLTRVAPLPL